MSTLSENLESKQAALVPSGGVPTKPVPSSSKQSAVSALPRKPDGPRLGGEVRLEQRWQSASAAYMRQRQLNAQIRELEQQLEVAVGQANKHRVAGEVVQYELSRDRQDALMEQLSRLRAHKQEVMVQIQTNTRMADMPLVIQERFHTGKLRELEMTAQQIRTEIQRASMTAHEMDRRQHDMQLTVAPGSLLLDKITELQHAAEQLQLSHLRERLASVVWQKELLQAQFERMLSEKEKLERDQVDTLRKQIHHQQQAFKGAQQEKLTMQQELNRLEAEKLRLEQLRRREEQKVADARRSLDQMQSTLEESNLRQQARLMVHSQVYKEKERENTVLRTELGRALQERQRLQLAFRQRADAAARLQQQDERDRLRGRLQRKIVAAKLSRRQMELRVLEQEVARRARERISSTRWMRRLVEAVVGRAWYVISRGYEQRARYRLRWGDTPSPESTALVSKTQTGGRTVQRTIPTGVPVSSPTTALSTTAGASRPTTQPSQGSSPPHASQPTHPPAGAVPSASQDPFAGVIGRLAARAADISEANSPLQNNPPSSAHSGTDTQAAVRAPVHEGVNDVRTKPRKVKKTKKAKKVKKKTRDRPGTKPWRSREEPQDDASARKPRRVSKPQRGDGSGDRSRPGDRELLPGKGGLSRAGSARPHRRPTSAHRRSYSSRTSHDRPGGFGVRREGARRPRKRPSRFQQDAAAARPSLSAHPQDSDGGSGEESCDCSDCLPHPPRDRLAPEISQYPASEDGRTHPLPRARDGRSHRRQDGALSSGSDRSPPGSPPGPDRGHWSDRDNSLDHNDHAPSSAREQSQPPRAGVDTAAGRDGRASLEHRAPPAGRIGGQVRPVCLRAPALGSRGGPRSRLLEPEARVTEAADGTAFAGERPDYPSTHPRPPSPHAYTATDAHPLPRSADASNDVSGNAARHGYPQQRHASVSQLGRSPARHLHQTRALQHSGWEAPPPPVARQAPQPANASVPSGNDSLAEFTRGVPSQSPPAGRHSPTTVPASRHPQPDRAAASGGDVQPPADRDALPEEWETPEHPQAGDRFFRRAREYKHVIDSTVQDTRRWQQAEQVSSDRTASSRLNDSGRAGARGGDESGRDGAGGAGHAGRPPTHRSSASERTHQSTALPPRGTSQPAPAQPRPAADRAPQYYYRPDSAVVGRQRVPALPAVATHRYHARTQRPHSSLPFAPHDRQQEPRRVRQRALSMQPVENDARSQDAVRPHLSSRSTYRDGACDGVYRDARDLAPPRGLERDPRSLSDISSDYAAGAVSMGGQAGGRSRMRPYVPPRSEDPRYPDRPAERHPSDSEWERGTRTRTPRDAGGRWPRDTRSHQYSPPPSSRQGGGCSDSECSCGGESPRPRRTPRDQSYHSHLGPSAAEHSTEPQSGGPTESDRYRRSDSPRSDYSDSFCDDSQCDCGRSPPPRSSGTRSRASHGSRRIRRRPRTRQSRGTPSEPGCVTERVEQPRGRPDSATGSAERTFAALGEQSVVSEVATSSSVVAEAGRRKRSKKRPASVANPRVFAGLLRQGLASSEQQQPSTQQPQEPQAHHTAEMQQQQQQPINPQTASQHGGQPVLDDAAPAVNANAATAAQDILQLDIQSLPTALSGPVSPRAPQLYTESNKQPSNHPFVPPLGTAQHMHGIPQHGNATQSFANTAPVHPQYEEPFSAGPVLNHRTEGLQNTDNQRHPVSIHPHGVRSVVSVLPSAQHPQQQQVPDPIRAPHTRQQSAPPQQMMPETVPQAVPAHRSGRPMGSIQSTSASLDIPTHTQRFVNVLGPMPKQPYAHIDPQYDIVRQAMVVPDNSKPDPNHQWQAQSHNSYGQYNENTYVPGGTQPSNNQHPSHATHAPQYHHNNTYSAQTTGAHQQYHLAQDHKEPVLYQQHSNQWQHQRPVQSQPNVTAYPQNAHLVQHPTLAQQPTAMFPIQPHNAPGNAPIQQYTSW